MTTATGKQVKGIEEILAERLEMISKGSCKTCRFCVPIDWENSEDIDGVLGTKASHYCAIQGNVNPIQFSEKSLKKMAYPWRCDDGNWVETMDCFAYQPRPMPLGLALDIAVFDHREYLKGIGEAQELDKSIRLVHSGVAEAKLRMLQTCLSHHEG